MKKYMNRYVSCLSIIYLSPIYFINASDIKPVVLKKENRQIEFSEVIIYSEKFLETAQLAKMHIAKGNVCTQKGDFVLAEKYYHRAIELEPHRSDWLLVLVELKSNFYNTQEALQELDKIIEMHPFCIEAYLFRASLYQKIGNNKLASEDQRIAVYLER